MAGFMGDSPEGTFRKATGSVFPDCFIIGVSVQTSEFRAQRGLSSVGKWEQPLLGNVSPAAGKVANELATANWQNPKNEKQKVLKHVLQETAYNHCNKQKAKG